MKIGKERNDILFQLLHEKGLRAVRAKSRDLVRRLRLQAMQDGDVDQMMQ